MYKYEAQNQKLKLPLETDFETFRLISHLADHNTECNFELIRARV